MTFATWKQKSISNIMKETKKNILEALRKGDKKDAKFESMVLNLALQKIDSDSFEFDGDAVYTSDMKRLVYCISQTDKFVVPEGVEVIGEMAFRGKKHLREVTIASTVKEIEQDAFYDCDELLEVTVPAGVRQVRAYAFAECDKLKTIVFLGVPKQLSRHAFDDCDSLFNIKVPVGASKQFRKELHFVNGDTDHIVVEDPTIPASAPAKAAAEPKTQQKGKAEKEPKVEKEPKAEKKKAEKKEKTEKADKQSKKK